jgi:hypothetical protein
MRPVNLVGFNGRACINWAYDGYALIDVNLSMHIKYARIWPHSYPYV